MTDYTSDGERPNAPSIGKNGEVFVGGHTRTFYAFNGVTGDVLWTASLPNANSYVSIVDVNNTVVTSDSNDSIYALNGSNGQFKWTLNGVGRIIYGLAFGNDGMLYAAAENRLLAIDPANGEIVHQYQHNNGTGNICLARDGTIIVQDSKLTAYRVEELTGIQNSPWPIYSHDPERTSFAGTSLTPEPINNAPVGFSQNLSTLEDNLLSITLSGADSDNDPLTFSVTTSPKHGVLVGQPPNLTYIPNVDYHGNDSFSFVTSDGESTSDPASISITVTSVNDRPSVISRNLSSNEDTNLSVQLAGSDVDGDSLQYRITSAPANGSLTGLAPNLVYVPNLNFFGTDSIQYVANDGITDSLAGSIQIRIHPVNDAPISLGANLSTLEDTRLTAPFNASDVDGDSLSFQIITEPQNGLVSISDNSFSYTPRSGFRGADSFTFVASDGQQISNTSQISINVIAVNKPPSALGQNLSVVAGEVLNITLEGNDPDLGDELSFDIIRNPLHGVLSGNPPTLVYKSNDGFVGFDNLSFTVSDGELTSNPATIAIEVIRGNTVPTATDDNLSTLEDTEIALTLKGHDDDGDELTYTITEAPKFGFLSGDLPNMTYRPSSNFNGVDTIQFYVSDAESSSQVASIKINVIPVNDAPEVQDLRLTTKERTPLLIALQAQDVENDPVEFRVNGQPAHGSLTGNLPNLTYTPQVGFVGIDTFSYIANDGTVDSDLKTVTISVVASNLAPEAIGTRVSGKQNDPIQITLSGRDPDGDNLEYIVVQNPRHGRITGSGSNLVYYPANDYVGVDSLLFRVNDGSLSSTPATVFIEIISKRRFPTLVGDISSISFLANATLLYFGETLVLSASTSINKDFQYSWYRNGELIETSTYSIHDIPNVSVEDTGQYHVVARSRDTELVSPKLLIEVSNEDSAVNLPFDTSEEVRAILGQRISFNSPVTGNGYSYVWRKDSNVLVGETGALLNFASNSVAQEGDYYLEVWNGENILTIHKFQLIFTTRIDIVRISDDITVQLDSGRKSSEWRLESSTDLKNWRLLKRYSILGKFLVTLPISADFEFFRLVEE